MVESDKVVKESWRLKEMSDSYNTLGLGSLAKKMLTAKLLSGQIPLCKTLGSPASTSIKVEAKSLILLTRNSAKRIYTDDQTGYRYCCG
jgi:hypothetical protein